MWSSGQGFPLRGDEGSFQGTLWREHWENSRERHKDGVCCVVLMQNHRALVMEEM